MRTPGEHALRDAARVFVADQCGRDLVDYGLIIATVVLVVLIGLRAYSDLIRVWYAALPGGITAVGR
jgi:Flp pilus assembly pilin Flp